MHRKWCICSHPEHGISVKTAQALAAATLRILGGLVSKDVFIVSAVRTPIGKFGGKLAQMTSPDLGVAAAKAVLVHARVDPNLVEETIFGSARQAGNGPNPARQISVRSGVPKE